MEESNNEVAPVGIMESFLLNQGPPTPELYYNKPKKYENDNKILISMHQKIEAQGKEIKELRNENEVLKNQLNEACQNIISISNRLNKYNNLDNYIKKLNQIQMSFLFNSLDDQLYKLEDSYKSLNHDLIKNRGEFGFINLGIKRVLKSNISKCILKYKASLDGKNPEVYHLKCDNIYYQLFIIKTTNERRFGVFFCNNKNSTMMNSNLYNTFNGFKENYMSYNYSSSKDIFYNYQSSMSMDFMDSNNLNELSDDNKNEIFNCNSRPDKFFAFNLNNRKIYYKNIKNNANTPCFSINYDPNRESYYGKEKKVAVNSHVKEFVLTGKEEFNILEFEVYEIEIDSEIKK